MSTNAYIGRLMGNDQVQYIYLHWNGHPSQAGEMLLKYYNTPDQVENLINLGDLSALCSNLKPMRGTVHNFESPAKDVTIAYHRDGYEPWNNTHPKFKTLDEFRRSSVPYVYLYDTHRQEWRIRKGKRFYKLKK